MNLEKQEKPSVIKATCSLALGYAWMQLGEGPEGMTIQADNLTDGA